MCIPLCQRRPPWTLPYPYTESRCLADKVHILEDYEESGRFLDSIQHQDPEYRKPGWRRSRLLLSFAGREYPVKHHLYRDGLGTVDPIETVLCLLSCTSRNCRPK